MKRISLPEGPDGCQGRLDLELLCDEDEPWIWREEGELEGVEVLVNGSVPIVYKINYPKNNENWYVFFFHVFFLSANFFNFYFCWVPTTSVIFC